MREITHADADAVFSLRSDAAIMKYIPRPLFKSHDDTLRFIASLDDMRIKCESVNWAIALKQQEGHLLGMICLIRIRPEHFRTEIGYILHPDARGNGLMQEAVKTVINYSFNTLGFHSLEAVVDPRNMNSIKVLESTGFYREGLFRENSYYNGKFLDSGVYSLLKTNPPTPT